MLRSVYNKSTIAAKKFVDQTFEQEAQIFTENLLKVFLFKWKARFYFPAVLFSKTRDDLVITLFYLFFTDRQSSTLNNHIKIHTVSYAKSISVLKSISYASKTETKT